MGRPDGASELVDLPEGARTYRASQRVRLSDTDARGLLRLDALFRYVQDIANDDARSTLDDALAWVVRKATVEVLSNPSEGEMLELTTWCGGFGSRWAERRTSIVGERGGQVEAVALWVAIDPTSGAPVPLPQDFHDAYADTARGRTVSSRLRHPPPPADARRQRWAFRAADVDIMGHVNNTAYWTVAEELMEPRPARLRAEVEFRAPTDTGVPLELAWASHQDGFEAWIMEDATVRASLRCTSQD